MRRPDDHPLDPEIVTTLDAIDATLAGEAVDPRHADLAELALMLAADRPVIEEGFARLLDQQVQERAFPKARARTSGERQKVRTSRRRRARWWVWAPAGAVAASLAAAVVIVAGQSRGGGPEAFGTSAAGTPSLAVRSAPKEKLAQAAPMPTPRRALQSVHAGFGSREHWGANGASSSGSSASSAATTAASTPAPPGNSNFLAPITRDRKVIQGAQLILSTSPTRVDQVSQEVYNVVGQENGIVKSSSVTANGGRGGYAQFQLSIPSANLARTMASLSTLPNAHVQSRTDSTQDVTNQYRVDQQHLNDARALHTSLLKQLANAITTAQIDSLQARIHDNEAAISADEAALHSLQRSIGYSQVNLAINSAGVPVPAHSSGGFTLGKAAHDAGRVLTVAAGVALIVLAALLPVGLLVALLWWIGRAARRRSRHQALDLA